MQGQRGTVCDDNWFYSSSTGVFANAQVVCRQQGLAWTGAQTSAFGVIPGNPGLPILMDDVECTGVESALQDCPRRASGNDCTHSEDVGEMLPPHRVCDGQPKDLGLANTLHHASTPLPEYVPDAVCIAGVICSDATPGYACLAANDIAGTDISSFASSSFAACAAHCNADSTCSFFSIMSDTFNLGENRNRCYLKKNLMRGPHGWTGASSQSIACVRRNPPQWGITSQGGALQCVVCPHLQVETQH